MSEISKLKEIISVVSKENIQLKYLLGTLQNLKRFPSSKLNEQIKFILSELNFESETSRPLDYKGTLNIDNEFYYEIRIDDLEVNSSSYVVHLYIYSCGMGNKISESTVLDAMDFFYVLKTHILNQEKIAPVINEFNFVIEKDNKTESQDEFGFGSINEMRTNND